MQEVIVGGLFALVTALVSGWLVDGGVKRRARRTIREEVELSKLFAPASDQANVLTASAERRVAAYVTPFWVRIRRLSGGQRLVAVALIVLVLFAVLDFTLRVAEPPRPSDGLAPVVAVFGIAGATVGLVAVILNSGLYGFVVALTRGIEKFAAAFAVAVNAFLRTILYGRRGGR